MNVRVKLLVGAKSVMSAKFPLEIIELKVLEDCGFLQLGWQIIVPEYQGTFGLVRESR